MRGILFWLALLAGVAAIAIALLMPAHLRATDPHVIDKLGAESRSVVQLAAETASHKPPVAKLLLATAEQLQLPGTERVLEELRTSAPDIGTVLARLEDQAAGRIQVAEIPVLTALRTRESRQHLSQSLQSSEAKQILRNRALTNLVIFAPVKSAAGVPLEVAILTTAFLLEQRAFPPSFPLHDQVLRLAGQADPAIEEFYLSIFALAKRFSSEQLIALVAHVPNVNALNSITRYIREHPDSAALIYSSIIAPKNGGAVATYIERFPKSVEQDFSFALAAGTGGIDRLLQDQQPVYRCSLYDTVTGNRAVGSVIKPFVTLSANIPAIAILLKLAFLALGGFLLATAMRLRKREVEESYVFDPKLSLIRRGAFAGAFVVLAVVLGEPYLAQGEQAPPRPRVTFPLLGAATGTPPPATTQKSTPMLDQHTILAIATFLALQAAIYAICLVKLAEIKKQPVSNVTKLKLLDNEDNLFDGGLYCGLFGTAASLILLTLGVIKPSLVSAYSSTLFGILFVALLKIGHVRPFKRRLLLEADEIEQANADAASTPAPVRNPFAS